MPLPNMPTRRAYYFDQDLQLRDYAGAAIAATTSETGVEFAVRDINLEKVIVHHAAIGGTVDAANFWAVAVEVSDVVGGVYTEIANSGPLAAVAGEVEVPISGKMAEMLDADSAFIRVTATLTGAAGALTYGAYVSPDQ